MTAAITGASIGFLVWAGWFFFAESVRGADTISAPFKAWTLMVTLTGSGAAIGWLGGVG